MMVLLLLLGCAEDCYVSTAGERCLDVTVCTDGDVTWYTWDGGSMEHDEDRPNALVCATCEDVADELCD